MSDEKPSPELIAVRLEAMASKLSLPHGPEFLERAVDDLLNAARDVRSALAVEGGHDEGAAGAGEGNDGRGPDWTSPPHMHRAAAHLALRPSDDAKRAACAAFGIELGTIEAGWFGQGWDSALSCADTEAGR